MPTMNIPELITKVKAGKTSIEVLAGQRGNVSLVVTRLNEKIRNWGERRKTFKYKVDRSNRHIADPNITHYLAYEADFLARRDADQEQYDLLTGHIDEATVTRDAELLALKEIDDALGPMRRGDFS